MDLKICKLAKISGRNFSSIATETLSQTQYIYVRYAEAIQGIQLSHDALESDAYYSVDNFNDVNTQLLW
jgi:hypothetical protein